MNKFIKLQLIFLLGVFLVCFSLSSCQKEDNSNAIGDFIISFGVVQNISNSGDNFDIHLDNGDILLTKRKPIPSFELFDNQRVLINFNPVAESVNKIKTKTYIGEVNDIKNILYKKIEIKSQVNIDSLGRDPIVVRDAWLSGDSILNIEFNFYSAGSVHNINLLDIQEGNGITKPFIFELRHNARGDENKYRVSGYVSFKLNPYKVPNHDRVEITIKYTDYDGKKTDIPLIFRY